MKVNAAKPTRTQLVARATPFNDSNTRHELHCSRGQFYFKPRRGEYEPITKAKAQNWFIRFFVEYEEMDPCHVGLLVNH